MATLARILVLNVYDLARAGEAVVAGAMPDQGLYGINHFERRGHTVAIVPFQVSERLKRASAVLRRTPVPLGDLDQQLGAMRELHGADLIYCPSQMVAQLLAYLRAVGALRRPLVWIVHHPLDRGRLRRQRTPLMRALLRGVDAYPALTGYVADELARVGGSAKRTGGLKWGPDPDWYPRGSPLGRGVVAAGWSSRDFDTFARAAAQTDVPAWIVCRKVHEPRVRLGAHTRLLHGLEYRELAALYAQARAIAIPLNVQWPWNLHGLTSLTDAMGMGMPVIVTRNPWIDVDVEALGIGVWVAPGDVAGWRSAIRYLDQNPDVAAEMGRRARALVDSGEYSSHAFAERVMDIFDRILVSPAR